MYEYTGSGSIKIKSNSCPTFIVRCNDTAPVYSPILVEVASLQPETFYYYFSSRFKDAFSAQSSLLSSFLIPNTLQIDSFKEAA